MNREWSNLAKVTFKRTYARKLATENGGTPPLESWEQTSDRAIYGNTDGFEVSDHEKDRLRYFFYNRKATVAGRGLWFSGTDAHSRIGGAALNNCWFVTMDTWMAYVIAQDLLMLGGGVGASVEHRFVSKLPKIKKNVVITHKGTKDADFIIPDSREGWCELTRRILKSYFVTGKSFVYSTVCVRGYGEPIAGFGGTASGPIPLIAFADKLCKILDSREGRQLRPIDAADIMCAIGEMVVAGNVRRSAIIIIGDAYDKDYLKAKRWDLGPIPNQRAKANWSVACEDIEDLHPLYWKTYEHGEAFGLINTKNMQKYGRMGELKKDAACGVNPCGEISLEPFEPCNLQEINLGAIESEEEFTEAAVLMHRWGKRVTCGKYHWPECDEVVKRNRRVGTGITGCLQNPKLFSPEVLDRVYKAIQEENVRYSKQLGIPVSIKTTTIKPSGTMSKVMDSPGEGLHPGFSRYIIQRIRFSADDALVGLLRDAGHYMEPEVRLDGSLNHDTMVVDFYTEAPQDLPVADEGYDTWKQLDALLMAQKYWSDNSVSISVYYKREEIPRIKQWLIENYKDLKTISFLCHSEHGFKQAPKEPITKEQYDKLSAKIRPINISSISAGEELQGMECAGGACPVR